MTEGWQTLLAVGLVAGDLSATSIARHAGCSLGEAEGALAGARTEGVLDADPDGASVDPEVARELVGALPALRIAEIHAAVGRSLLSRGSEGVESAVGHLRAAAALVPSEELLPVVGEGARMCLSFSDYHAARLLYRLAVDLDTTGSDLQRVDHLMGLGRALDGLGRSREAHDLMLEACELAIVSGLVASAAEAVVEFALPADWNYSDRQSLALIDRVQRMELDVDARVTLGAVRSLAESWVPTGVMGDQQLAWVSRSSVSQPMAETALAAAAKCSPRVRLLALLAWRWTHRAPRHAERRRIVSTEALDLAQAVGDPRLIVESAVACAVDALESGDRPAYERALAVARWVADHDTAPRLRWRATTLLVGALHLDGEVVIATSVRTELADSAGDSGVPGWMAADLFLRAEELWDRRDPDAFAALQLDGDDPSLAHPIGRLTFAMARWYAGDESIAIRDLRRVVRGLDAEASLLLTATLAARVAVVTNDAESLQRLLEVLEPHSQSVAIDAHGWWCAGPVALALAELHHARLNDNRARVLLGIASSLAADIDDVRSLQRARELSEIIGSDDGAGEDLFGLTIRERAVLRHIVEGRTNPMIAEELAFSVSTVRMDTISIYRKLGVSGRREARSKMLETGYVDLL